MPQVHQLPSSRLEVTAEIAYVRFHGQNPEQWAKTTTRNERCDYDYSDEALKEWVEPITNLGKYQRDDVCLVQQSLSRQGGQECGGPATHA
jgi:uncharacterized protein YecE (DUF72 family)